MAVTKGSEAVDAWAEIAQNAIREGATKDLDPNYVSTIHIDIALTSETAHTGTQIIIQISTSDADDEFWQDFDEVIGPTGTANKEDITNNPLAAAATTITVASTTGYTTTGWRFLEDATLANSELVWENGYTTDTNITIQDGVKREHANTADLYNIAKTYPVLLPMTARRARVLYNNKYDADGATVATRTRLTKVTAV